MNMKKQFFILILLGFSFAFCQAQVIYTQTDWSGGSGQETLTDFTKFYAENNVDYSSIAGEIKLIENNNTNFYGLVEFQGKLIIGSSAGIFSLNPLTNEWDHLYTGSITLTHSTIHNNILYCLYGNNVYSYDGSTNDYGYGPNGWKYFSDLTPLGTSSTFTIESVDGDLLIGARRGYDGCALKWNSTTETWEDLGASFSQGVTAFAKYNGELYAGTHWWGEVFKWNGTSWLSVYDSPLMTMSTLVVKGDILYAGGYSSQTNTGKIYAFDGSNWNVVYDGYGVRKMILNGDNIDFSVQRSSDSNSNNLPGQLYRYNGSTNSLINTFATESFAYDLLALDGDLYYGGYGYSAFGGETTSNFYKNDQVLEKVYGGYLYSSDIVNSTGAWGAYIEYDITDSNYSGVFVTLREKRSDGSYGPIIQYPANTIIDLTENTIQYLVYFWGLQDADLPSMQEIQLQTSDYLATENSDIPMRFKLYPNPSNGKIQIQVNQHSNYSLRIYNYLGKMVYTDDQMDEGLVNLDLSNLVKGIYLVEVKQNKRRSIQKLEIY